MKLLPISHWRTTTIGKGGTVGPLRSVELVGLTYEEDSPRALDFLVVTWSGETGREVRAFTGSEYGSAEDALEAARVYFDRAVGRMP